MNLRLCSNELRFRVTKSEASRLLETQTLTELVPVSHGHTISIVIHVSDKLNLKFSNLEFELEIPATHVRRLSQAKERSEMCWQTKWPDETGQLNIVFEVDVFSKAKDT